MPNIKVFGGSSHPELAKLICERLGISLGRSTLKKFSNKETRYVEIGKEMTKPIVSRSHGGRCFSPDGWREIWGKMYKATCFMFEQL